MAVKFTRRLKTKVVLDMAPMIDIVFQLIIFFMLATQVKVTTGMEFELPKAKNLSSISEAPLKITLISRSVILVDNTRTSFDNFPEILKDTLRLNQSSRKSVVLYGNKKMEYELLIDVMDILKEYGYSSIDLALDRKY